MNTRCNVSVLFILGVLLSVRAAVWEEVASDLPTQVGPSATCCQIIYSTPETAWVHCSVSADSQCVFKSVDGGKTWTLLRVGCTYPGYYVNPRSISFADSRNGWILDGDSLLRTTDGGETWAAQPMGVANAQLLIFKSALRGYTITDTSFFTTSDGGTTWEEHAPGGNGSNELYDCCFLDTLRGWLVAQGGLESGKTWKTVDGGVTWAGVNGVGLFRCIAASDTMHYAEAGDNGGFAGTREMKVTFTGGVTWQTYRPSASVRSIGFLTGTYGIAASYSEGVFLETLDGGTTWSPLQTIVGAGSMSISVSGDRMYLLTVEGKVFSCALSTGTGPKGAAGSGMFRTATVKMLRRGTPSGRGLPFGAVSLSGRTAGRRQGAAGQLLYRGRVGEQ